MDSIFFAENRQRLLKALPDGAVAVLFAGEAPRKSADAYHPFFADRNYLYLSGVEYEGFVLLLSKQDGRNGETLYILPKDPVKERWNGYRYSAGQAKALSGIDDIRYIEEFENDWFTALGSGKASGVWLDLYKNRPAEPDDTAHRFANRVKNVFPWLPVENLLPHMRRLRTIKTPSEIEAIKKAETVTKAGIVAMMKASRPGMYEYELKAEFDYALLKHGVLAPAFPPIISAGQNNFYLHYNSCAGKINEGDMILTDVGAQWDGLATDVSRGWPAGGKFSKEQAALYNAAYHTSNYMFGVIRPGMAMKSVDETARRVCAEELKKLGLLGDLADAGRYVWHGGAHHVGWDTHDMVETDLGGISEGMVFCVDVGIYCEEWGIGFRLEDNCLVTETGCVNLSADIPRSIEEIEAVING